VERGGEASQIEIEGGVSGLLGSEGRGIFCFWSEGKLITGTITVPNGILNRKLPVVVMLRGYADREVYYPGYGTQNAAKYYAASGYVSMAPDFLGFGGSDAEDEDALGARIKRPVTVLDLLASLPSLDFVDTGRVYLWGHSNGGQIGLSVQEILGRREEEGRSNQVEVKAAVLWAPVSKPFPYNILYYTDEASDSGKWLRGKIAKFEADYDVYDFSLDKYWDWMSTPLQIHQGTADEAVPLRWSDELAKNLQEREKEVKYYVYKGADHNMRPSWETVVARDVVWFQEHSQ